MRFPALHHNTSTVLKDKTEKATKACRSGTPENPQSTDCQLLSVEAAGFLAASSFVLTLKCTATPAPAEGTCTDFPECLLEEWGLSLNKRTIFSPPQCCKMSKIQLSYAFSLLLRPRQLISRCDKCSLALNFSSKS